MKAFLRTGNVPVIVKTPEDPAVPGDFRFGRTYVRNRRETRVLARRSESENFAERTVRVALGKEEGNLRFAGEAAQKRGHEGCRTRRGSPGAF